MRRVAILVCGLAAAISAMVSVSTFGQFGPGGPPPQGPPPGGGGPPGGEGPPGRGGPPGPPPPPLGVPLSGLGAADLARFKAGKTTFLQPEDVPGGLGPVFTENACAVCHNGAAVGGPGVRLVTRFGRIVNGQYDPMVEFGGPLVQDKGIGKFNGVNFVGEIVPPQATIVAKRRTTSLFGLGLVDAVPDDVFMHLAQVEQLNHPTTAGRPAIVIDPATNQPRVGKFGWKAQQPNLFAFSGDAYVNEMGVTAPLFPNENCPQGNCALLAANPAKTHPNDLTNDSIQEFTDFISLLAPTPPMPVGPNEAAGSKLFVSVGCTDCHMPTFQTGHHPVPALSGATFSPYSDFLLHDMGSLGDGIAQGAAGPREMRTAPLWGLRFQPFYLHDGRARTPVDAIQAHDGQGRGSRDRFNALSPSQRSQLIAFLNAL